MCFEVYVHLSSGVLTLFLSRVKRRRMERSFFGKRETDERDAKNTSQKTKKESALPLIQESLCSSLRKKKRNKKRQTTERRLQRRCLASSMTVLIKHSTKSILSENPAPHTGRCEPAKSFLPSFSTSFSSRSKPIPSI